MMRDESGITGIEYGLLASLVAVSMMGAADLMGQEVQVMVTGVADEVTLATP